MRLDWTLNDLGFEENGVTFPAAGHHCLLKLYCLVALMTKAHVRDHYCDSKSVFSLVRRL